MNTVSADTSGQYHTNEVSTELLLPIVGHDFTVPAITSLELEGAYRYVNNSRLARGFRAAARIRAGTDRQEPLAQLGAG